MRRDVTFTENERKIWPRCKGHNSSLSASCIHILLPLDCPFARLRAGC